MTDAQSVEAPSGGLGRLLFKVRGEGLSWLWQRLAVELSMPSTLPGQLLHRALRRSITAALAPCRLACSWFVSHPLAAPDHLYAFYDLKVQPITYDIVWFLAAADAQRRRLGLKGVHVVIVPGPHSGMRKEEPAYDAVVDVVARRWRVHNLVGPAVSLLPSCSGFSVMGSREQASALRHFVGGRLYPREYEPSLPVAHRMIDCVDTAGSHDDVAVLRASPQGLRYVDDWLLPRQGGRRVVTITLRDYGYGADRNSNVEAWLTFARGLDPVKYLVVLVLDTESSLGQSPADLAPFELFSEASWNVCLRAALYERAWLNMGVNNGPMSLCWLNSRTRYLTFKMLTPTVAQTTAQAFERLGIKLYESLPFATAAQKWVWEPDTLEVITREFQSMVATIESFEAAGTQPPPASEGAR